MTKVAKLTAEQLAERRKYDRERKAAQREQLRAERERQEPLEYDQAREAYLASPERKQVDQYINDTIKTIYDELQLPENFNFCRVDEALDRVLTLHYCFEYNLVFQSFHGPLYGGYWAEVSGEDVVRWRHQFDLCRSKSFSDVYWPLIRKLEKMYGNNIASSAKAYRTSAQAVRDELSGCYQYPPPAPVVAIPESKPEVKLEPDTDLQLQQVLDRKRQQLAEEIARYGQLSPFIAPEARKYLNGGFR